MVAAGPAGVQTLHAQLYPARVVSGDVSADASPSGFDPTGNAPMFINEVERHGCQGPLNKVTDLPSERCAARATESLLFAHSNGGAFVFACAAHMLELARWAGRRFGGCWSGEIAKVPIMRAKAQDKGFPLCTPHGAEYSRLTRAPGAPRVQHPFS